MLKVLAYFANAALIATIVFLILTEGFPSRTSQISMVVLMLVTPTISIIALFLAGGDGWLSLYFRRRSLEEKARIAEIEKKLGADA